MKRIRWRNIKKERMLMAKKLFEYHITMCRDDWFSKGFVLQEFDEFCTYLNQYI